MKRILTQGMMIVMFIALFTSLFAYTPHNDLKANPGVTFENSDVGIQSIAVESKNDCIIFEKCNAISVLQYKMPADNVEFIGITIRSYVYETATELELTKAYSNKESYGFLIKGIEPKCIVQSKLARFYPT